MMLGVIQKEHRNPTERTREVKDMKQVRIKKWFLQKNNMFASCPSQRREGRYTESSWLNVTKETEKAYHLDQTQMYMPEGGWIPKSVCLEVREKEERT